MAERRRRRSPQKPAEAGQATGEDAPKEKKENLLSFVLWVGLIAFVFKSFLIDTFWIPSGSMEPTLDVGDFIVVTKWSYGYNRHSLMFDPPIFKGQRFWSADPQRGDVVVFDSTTRGQGGDRVELENGGYHVIKRVIGLPGDRVHLIDGLIEITTREGEVLTFTRTEIELPGESALSTTYEETNPEGRTYQVRELLGAKGGDNFDTADGNWLTFSGDGLVPEGHVFVMGDNRDRSGDSRVSLRSIPMYKIVGRAQLTLFSLGESWLPRWDRFVRPIR